jgi:sugar/nucleoside kinase (ribokinase family)
MVKTGYKGLIGIGGIGSGIFFELEGNHTLGRNESRLGVLSNARDFCKLHIICHYIAVLMRSDSADKSSFQTVAIGRVGRDETGRGMVRMMQQTGMDTSLVKETDGAATLFSACFQYPDSSGGNITTARSASSLLTPEDVRQAKPVCDKYGTRGMALAAPEVPLECRLELLKMAAEYGLKRFCAFNSAELRDRLAVECISHTDCIAMNRDEAETLAGENCNQNLLDDFLELVRRKLLAINPDIRILVTLGSSGSYGFENDNWEFTPCAEVEPKSTAGAGDATLAGIIVATACGLPFILPERKKRNNLAQTPLESACDFAALLASLSVLSMDTINLETTPARLAEHGRMLGAKLSTEIESLLA